MRLAILITAAALLPVIAGAQTCAHMTQSYEAANSAPVRNRPLVERARRDMMRACGDGEVQPQPLAAPSEALPPGRAQRNSQGAQRVLPRKQ